MSGGGTGLMSGGGLSIASGGLGISGFGGCSIMHGSLQLPRQRGSVPQTSSPMARMSASALLCSTIPGFIR